MLAIAVLLTANLSGCSSDESEPAAVAQTDPPRLPDPQQLTFDFGFFDGAAELDKADRDTHLNFINAYLRVVVLDAMAQLTLAPPVAVFALALHTPPSLQEDGSWIWVYTWVDGVEETQVRLRGLPAGNRVEWELRLTARHAQPPLDAVVWFQGSTAENGDEGRWFFNDLDEPEHPLCGEIAWGDAGTGRHLTFISHEPETTGDTLRFSDNDPEFAVEFNQAVSGSQWYMRWHADGSGSLRVPDYNGGQPACWDERQRDVDCH